MKRAIIGAVIVMLGSGLALAAQRGANNYKATKVSNSSVIVSCNDEREPVISKLENTTAVVLTCKLVK